METGDPPARSVVRMASAMEAGAAAGAAFSFPTLWYGPDNEADSLAGTGSPDDEGGPAETIQ
ncbi:MAG TPA: hypothetical protein VFT75_09840 [Nocardioidaceae bacterium]|nr:hypothetical protein [Nocardioidaceae bacterium]